MKQTVLGPVVLQPEALDETDDENWSHPLSGQADADVWVEPDPDSADHDEDVEDGSSLDSDAARPEGDGETFQPALVHDPGEELVVEGVVEDVVGTDVVDVGSHDAATSRAVNERDGGRSTKVPPELVGYFPAQLLLRGFLTALEAACRTGIPVRALGGRSVVRTADGATYLRSTANRRAVLEAELADFKKRKANAMREIEVADDDDERRADWREKEAQARTTIRRIEGELRDLEGEIVQREQPRMFRTYADMVAAALAALAQSQNRVTQRQYEAINTLLEDFQMTRDNLGQWTASATIRLNLVGGGLAAFGPVEWPVGVGGRGAPTRPSHLAGREQDSKEALHTLLRATGRLGRDQILLLLNASFDELAHVVLHGTTGRPFPAWVGPEWQSPPFVEWVTRRYTDPTVWWRPKGSYVSISPMRQLLAHLAYESDRVDIAHVRTVVPFKRDQRVINAARTYGATGRTPWFPPVVELPTARMLRPMPMTARGVDAKLSAASTNWAFTAVICECGKRARIVARVPEVPRCLLCECGRMPEAQRFGMDPEVRFPRQYQQMLMLSKQECVTEIIRAFEQGATTLGKRELKVMSQTDLLTRGTTAREMAARLGASRQHGNEILNVLERQGLVQRTGPRPWTWTFAEQREAPNG